MDLDRARIIVDNLLLSNRGKGLGEAESLVLEAAWHSWSYEKAAENSEYSHNYLQRTIAPKLWRFLTQELGKGKTIDKRRFRSHMLQLGDQELSTLAERSQKFKNNWISSRVEGGTLPSIHKFFGRNYELNQLSEAILYCRCVVVTGIVGVGKTTLVSKYIHNLVENSDKEIEQIIWWPIHYSTPFLETLTELIKQLDPIYQELNLSPVPQILVNHLIQCFKARRCLVILDGMESLLQSGDREHFESNYEVSEVLGFLNRVIKEWHQSCLLLTSRAWIKELTYQQESGLSVYQFQLKGLDMDSSKDLLKSQGIEVDGNWEKLIKTYRGNPLILERISTQSKHFFKGNLDILFTNRTSLGRDVIQDLFREQLEKEVHLGRLESDVLYTLSNNELGSMTFGQLFKKLSHTPDVSAAALVRSLGILEDFCLIESSSEGDSGELSLSLQPVIRNYIQSDPHGLIAAPLNLSSSV